MFGFFKSKKKVSFNEQLLELQKIGIKLNKNISEELILNEHGRKEFEKDPYLLLLIALGSEIEIDENFLNCSDEIWYLDTECIEDTGDYVRIAKRIKELSNGLLNIENIIDTVDIENLEASISFNFEGTEYNWNLDVNDDWLDETILFKLNELLKLKDSERSITILNLGGQDCLVGIYSEEQVKYLNNLLNGSKFESIS